ncbi:MAG: hypothetical protein KatS3mg101_0967 [Patescibacteria group bacterium]|nr:MAG: hypothetical protein KatS3mg101_0967 [Patescibacteria group bacterium]
MHPNPLGRDKDVIIDRCLNSFLEANDSKFPITFVV